MIAQASSVAEALACWDAHQPDVVVTDLQLPDGTGFDIIRAIRRQSPATGLVMLTMHSGDEQIFTAMEAGASAFVGKDAPIEGRGECGETRARVTTDLHVHRSGGRDDASGYR